MSLSNVFKISSQGMTAQRERLEAAASNLANANSTRSVDGGVYRRRDVVFRSNELEEDTQSDGPQMRYASWEGEWELAGRTDGPEGVSTTTVRARPDEVIKQYQPDHPDADADGYVTMPDVDPLEETVNMLSAARSFESNATVFSTAKEMVRTSLRLGDV